MDMTPQEINLAIVKLIYPEYNFRRNCTTNSTIYAEDIGFVDYCNNWNDLMPLVVEHEINFYRNNDELFVTYNKKDMQQFHNKRPQIALATCLLKVLEVKSNG